MAEYGTQTALIVVDVQNDFADPAGSLSVPGGMEVVAFANDQVDAAEAGGALVVFTQDWHPPTTPHFAKDGGTWRTAEGPRASSRRARQANRSRATMNRAASRR